MNAWGPYRPPTWRQPVGWGALHESPPVVTAPVVRQSPSAWIFNGVLRPAWAYRLELTLIALVAAAYVWLGHRLGREGAERIIVAASLVVAAVTWTRELLARALFRSHLRRRWALACRHAELATPNDRIPRITCCQLTRAGEQLQVRVPAGSQVPDLEAQAERIAAFLSVREVRVTRDPASARHAKVVVLRRPAGRPHPGALAARLGQSAVALAAHPGRHRRGRLRGHGHPARAQPPPGRRARRRQEQRPPAPGRRGRPGPGRAADPVRPEAR